MGTPRGFAFFETAIGICGIAWAACAIRAVQLPEGSATATRQRLARRFPTAHELDPPPEVQRAIDLIRDQIAGTVRDLRVVALDMDDLPPFERRVYEVAREIPSGSTLTYGEVAARIGEPQSSREVGQALGRNPFPIVVPCHRVLAAGGRPGGFSARGGVATKLRLLEIEKALPPTAPTLFDQLPLAAKPPRHPRLRRSTG
jgi:methylated-DNA-[protein]-cysteine S-methyltransferase